MTRFILSFTCLVAVFELTAQSHDPFIADFLSKWENAHAYTMDFAESMPADKYDYRPTPDQRDFSGQLVHICGNIIWLSLSYLDGEELQGTDLDNPPTDKESVIKLLNTTFAYAAKTVANFDTSQMDESVNFFSGPMSKRKIFFLLMDHVTHHRGQLVVYLRLNGIEPARYRGW